MNAILKPEDIIIIPINEIIHDFGCKFAQNRSETNIPALNVDTHPIAANNINSQYYSGLHKVLCNGTIVIELK